MKSLKAVLLGLLAVGAFSAQAEYLLWQMDWDDVDDTVDYATIVVMNAQGTVVDTLALAPDPDVSADAQPPPGTTEIYRGEESPVDIVSIIPSAYAQSPYTFALKTYDDSSDQEVATYGPTPYADISNSIWGGDYHPGVSTAWSPTKYAVPEPATGTLFILGSLMLFRRKRA